MPRPTAQQLRSLAFDALEEAISQAEMGPVRRSWALRLALAYLATLHPPVSCPGDPYRDFWRALSIGSRAARLSALEIALRIIYVRTDSKRDDERVAAIREHARQLDLERPQRRLAARAEGDP
nr:hypothetical protein [Sphingomonas sp.]